MRTRDQLNTDVKSDLDNTEILNTGEMTIFLLDKILKELKTIRRNTTP